MFKQWIKQLWPDAYIVFTQSPEGLNATQYTVKNSEVEMVDESSFVIENDGLSKECVEYVQEFLSTYPQTQLLYLTNALSCSAVGTCKKSDMAELDVDISIIKSICKNGFSSYVSVMDLENDNLLFKPFSLDYIYSPFFIMDELKQTFNGTMLLAMHVQDRLYVAIYKNDKLIYADNSPIGTEESFEDEIGGDDVDDMDADFDLDDLGDFEDELDDLDDFDEDIEGMDEDIEDSDEEDMDSIDEDEMEANDELKEYDLKLYDALKSSITKFYNDEKIASDFVEHIQVLDTVSLSQNVFDLIRDELFCEVDVSHVDIHRECLELMLKENK